MASINDAENVQPLPDIVAEIHEHAVRIQGLQDRARAAVTPDEKLAVALDLASEVSETIMPLFADFSKAAGMAIEELEDEVFPVKLGQAAAESISGTLEKCKVFAVGNPELTAEIEAAQEELAGDDDDFDDEEEGDGGDEEEGEGDLH